jgi:phage protein D
VSVETDKHVALYEILLADNVIDAKLASSIREIRVVDYLALPDLCTFTVGFDTGAPEQPPAIDRHPFDIGTALEIRLGATDEMAVKSVFKGEIVTLEPMFSAGGAELTVRAFDRAHRLNRSRKVRMWQNQTASDIVKSICDESKLDAKTDSSGDAFEFMQQNNETDLDFIWRLAHRIGFEFIVDDETAHFRAVDSGSSPIEVEWPREVFSFRPRLTAVQQVKEVNVRAFDPKTKDVFSSTAGSPKQTAQNGISRDTVANAFGDSTFQIVTEPAHTADEAKALAQALLDRLANAYVTAEGSALGEPRIRAGTSIKVKGVGSKFSGTYRVASTNHVLSGGSSYITEFSSTAIQTLTGAIAASRPSDFGSQLVVGIVTNNKDPDEMGRVRVKYPVLSDDKEGWWARVVTPSAGKERGLMMLPVEGEEVLVGFEHDDTTRPYVIGSVFNGKDKPGKELAADDGSLGILSDHKIVMKSKEDMKITSDAKLELQIKGDGTLKFDAARKEQVGTNFDLKVGSNMTTKSDMNLSLEAGAQLTIKGAMISIESSGPLTIKGNPVSIDGGTAVSISGIAINLG